jgi:hypothetical protein
MAELADVSDLGPDEFIRKGSSPFIRNLLLKKLQYKECVAQSVEQWAFNLVVVGSNPTALKIYINH